MSHPEDRYDITYNWDDKDNLRIDVTFRYIVNPEGKTGTELFTETTGETKSFHLSFPEGKIGDLSDIRRYLSQAKNKEKELEDLQNIIYGRLREWIDLKQLIDIDSL